MKIAVVGAGAWGSALACLAARQGHETMLWAREAEVADSVNDLERNPAFLPGVSMRGVRATQDLAALRGSDLTLLATPARYAGSLAREIASPTRLVVCAKGLDEAGRLPLQAMRGVASPEAMGMLAGPTFADPVARGMPSAAVVAATNLALAEFVVAALSEAEGLRLVACDDPIGAQVAGVMKNIVAIACGMAVGSGLGPNAHAAIMAAGAQEMVAVGLAAGGRVETLMGLAGVGDLVLTCSHELSRNMALGISLGKGQPLATALRGPQAREGVVGAAQARDWGRALGGAEERASPDMAFCAAVADTLSGRLRVREALRQILDSAR